MPFSCCKAVSYSNPGDCKPRHLPPLQLFHDLSNSNSNLTFTALNLHRVVDSKAQKTIAIGKFKVQEQKQAGTMEKPLEK